MTEVFFYQLGQRPLAEVLSGVLSKSRDQGWRITVRGSDQERMAQLDAFLWLFPKDGFLPHGTLGDDFDSDQPILLSTKPTTVNEPDALIVIDGATIAVDEVECFKRVSLIFNGNDPNEILVARTQWKQLKKAAVPVQYWKEKGNRWVQSANVTND